MSVSTLFMLGVLSAVHAQSQTTIFETTPNYTLVFNQTETSYGCDITTKFLQPTQYTTVKECYDRCSTELYCTYFSWNPTANLCRLFNGCIRKDGISNQVYVYAVTLDLRIPFLSTDDTDTVWKGDCIYSNTYLYKLCVKQESLDLTDSLDRNPFWSYTFSNSNDKDVYLRITDIGTLRLMVDSTSGWTLEKLWTFSDSTKDPYYLQILDSGPAWVARNKNLKIVGGIYWENEVAVNDPNIKGACDQLTNGGGKDRADYGRYGLDIGIAIIGMMPGPGGKIKSIANMALKSFDEFGDSQNSDTAMTTIFQCITEYVDYRISLGLSNINEDELDNFQEQFDNVVEQVQNHFGGTPKTHLIYWGTGSLHYNIYWDYSSFLTSGGDWTPAMVTWMNFRNLHWAYTMSLYNWGNSGDIVQYIIDNEIDYDAVHTAMFLFRDINGFAMDDYIYNGLRLSWVSVANDDTLTTLEKHRELKVIWMDGVICDYWIPLTHSLSQHSDFIYTAYSESYDFEGFDFTYFSGADCKVKVLEEIVSNGGFDNYVWEPKNIHGLDLQTFNAYTLVAGGTKSRCVKKSTKQFNELSCSTSGSGSIEEFITQITVGTLEIEPINWRPSSNIISGQIVYAKPMIERIPKVKCKNVQTGATTSYSSNPIYFFEPTNGGSNACDHSVVRTQYSSTCDTGSVATGIAYYYGVLKNNQYGYFLWKIRLMCRPYSVYGIDDAGYKIDNFTISDAAGDNPRDNGELNWEWGPAWTPFYECAPGHAMYSIKSNGGWDNGNNGKAVKVDYKIRIKCRSLFDATINY